MTSAGDLSETRSSCMTALFVAIISPKISGLHGTYYPDGHDQGQVH